MTTAGILSLFSQEFKAFLDNKVVVHLMLFVLKREENIVGKRKILNICIFSFFHIIFIGFSPWVATPCTYDLW